MNKRRGEIIKYFAVENELRGCCAHLIPEWFSILNGQSKDLVKED